MNKDIEQLKPCPFCGGEADIFKVGKNSVKIECRGCNVSRIQKYLRLTVEQLFKLMIDSWNKRV